jgi:hypothetical protein
MAGRTNSQMEEKKKFCRSIYKIFVNLSHKNPFWGAKKFFLKGVAAVFWTPCILKQN